MLSFIDFTTFPILQQLFEQFRTRKLPSPVSLLTRFGNDEKNACTALSHLIFGGKGTSDTYTYAHTETDVKARVHWLSKCVACQADGQLRNVLSIVREFDLKFRFSLINGRFIRDVLFQWNYWNILKVIR